MLRFEAPVFLWLLWLLPFLVAVRFVGWRVRCARLRRLGDPALLRQLMPGMSKVRPTLKFTLILLALASIIVMLARPQMGSKISHDKRQGIETMICLDISNSMLAEDVAPSRLDKSKMLIENLVDKFANDKIGLIVFAGDAFVQLPITNDYVSAKMFLQNITPSLIQTQGTNFAEAVSLATKSFTQQDNVGRAIIIITDGENHELGATEAVEAAKKKGINVFVLGIGNRQGAPIPVGDGSYLKDNSGNTVMTKLNDDMCREMAQAGNGRYIHVDNTSDAEQQLNADLARLQKGEADVVTYSEYDEQFQVMGILVVLLLMMEACLLEGKNPKLARLLPNMRRPRFGHKALAVLVLLFAAQTAMQAQTDRSLIRQGNKEYRHRDWSKAEVAYRKAIGKNANNPQAAYNLGCALMMQLRDSLALQQYANAAQMETNKFRRAKCFHNMGVIMQNHREFAQAIAFYKDALRCNPQDNETRYNLVLCQRQLKNQPNNKDKDNKQNKDNEQNKDNKQNKDKDKQDKNQENKQDKQDKKQGQQNQEKMSRDNAEQLLNAAVQQEKATKQKMQKAMSQPRRRQYEKNW